jgi:hypothetical protein
MIGENGRKTLIKFLNSKIMSNSLLLLENSSDVKTILSNHPNLENFKIICFDIESNSLLSELGIKHELMENYLNSTDEAEIDTLALEKALSWHTQKNFEDFLVFRNINLGWLLEIEIHQYLLQTIKHLIGILRIFEIEKPTNIHASKFLSSLIHSINFEIGISIHTFLKSNSLKFYFDTVEIPINLGSKKFNLKTSRNFALKIKKTLEQLTNLFFNLKYKKNFSKKKHILLLEFNPIQYDILIKRIASLDDQLIFLNERRPAVWNLESLKILKKSNSKILNLTNISTNVNQKIQLEKSDFFKKLDDLFLLDHDFKDFFSIRGLSFWFAIKEDFIRTCKERFSEAIPRIISSEKFFENNKIDCILTMYNAGAEERAILSVAQKYNVSGILMQHGIYPENLQHTKFLPVSGFVPNIGLKFASWGNEIKRYFIELGIDDDKLILVGSPRHDHFFNTKICTKNNNSILLATNIIMGHTYKGIDSRIYHNFQVTLKEILKISNNIPEKKLVVKLHPGKPPVDIISKILDEIKPPLEVSKTGNIFDHIINSDIVISTEFSTVLIDAMILKKPTITFLFDDKGFQNEKIIQSGATAYVKNIQEFSEVLNKILTDDDFQKNLVNKGTKFINNYMTNPGHSSEFLAKYVHDM